MKTEKSTILRRSKYCLLGVGALALAAAVVFLPDLSAYYDLTRTIDNFAQKDAATGGKWPQVHDECVLCHGFGGNTVTQIYPRLAGQPDAYLSRQLAAFADETRHDAHMSPLAKSMSPQEIESLADYFAKQAAEPNHAFMPDKARAARGESLVKDGNCAACHGETLTGQEAVPRLRGQGRDYLVEQMTAFKLGQRKDPDGGMAAVAAALSPDDIADLAEYLAAN